MFRKEHSNTATSTTNCIIKFFFLKYNLRILLQTIKIMRGKNFKKVDHIDCKIIVFEVKKRAFLTPCKTWLTNFEFS
jgi:hypothetical protein